MDIAIVDDERMDREIVQKYMAAYIKKQPCCQAVPVRYSMFASAEALLARFSAGTYDLIMLDIVMDRMNGIEAAQYIRAMDTICQIVFLTNSTDFLLDGYRVFASGYLLKPLERNEMAFLHTMEHCLPQLVARSQILTVTVEHTLHQIPFYEIGYLDCNNQRTVTLHLRNGQIMHTTNPYAKCRELLLVSPEFLECYNHLIVDMDYIAEMQETDFLLENKEKIPISRRRKKEVMQQYITYLLNK